jgi:hypothetical protein
MYAAYNDKECVNMLPSPDGSMHIIMPKKNAVIIQVVDTGNGTFRKIVSIECMDESLYPELLVMAEEALQMR